YEARRAHFIVELRKELGEWLDFSVPSGGMALWARAKRGLPVSRWHACAKERGVLFQPGSLFTFDHHELDRVRLGYCGLTEKELTEAVARLKTAAVEAASRG